MSSIVILSLIGSGMSTSAFIANIISGLIESALLAITFEGVRPSLIFISRIATSIELSSICLLLLFLIQLALSLSSTGMGATVLCICMIAIIIALPSPGILLGFIIIEYDQRLLLWKEMLIMQRRLIRELRERKEEWKQLLQKLLLFPSVSYTNRGIGSKYRDCAICLNDFVEGELCRVLPSCKHVFHSSCIDPWLRTHLSCPVCRNSVLDVWEM